MPCSDARENSPQDTGGRGSRGRRDAQGRQRPGTREAWEQHEGQRTQDSPREATAAGPGGGGACVWSWASRGLRAQRQRPGPGRVARAARLGTASRGGRGLRMGSEESRQSPRVAALTLLIGANSHDGAATERRWLGRASLAWKGLGVVQGSWRSRQGRGPPGSRRAGSERDPTSGQGESCPSVGGPGDRLQCPGS